MFLIFSVTEKSFHQEEEINERSSEECRRRTWCLCLHLFAELTKQENKEEKLSSKLLWTSSNKLLAHTKQNCDATNEEKTNRGMPWSQLACCDAIWESFEMNPTWIVFKTLTPARIFFMRVNFLILTNRFLMGTPKSAVIITLWTVRGIASQCRELIFAVDWILKIWKFSLRSYVDVYCDLFNYTRSPSTELIATKRFHELN